LFVLLSIACAMLFASCAEPIEPELDVTPLTDTIETKQAVKLTVTRRYTGGVSRDVTHVVSYSSSNDNVANVTAQGVLTGGPQTGVATIRVADLATHTSKSFSVTVVVPANQRIIAIDVVPATFVLPPASVHQYTAQARYADASSRDVTRQVIWASDRPEVAIVGTTSLDYGIVRTLANGRARVTATDSLTGIQGAADLFVQGTATQLEAIVVTPNPAGPLPVGMMQQFTATGFFANSTMRDITATVQWQTSVPGVASVSPTGLATGMAAGDTTISAIGTDPGIRGSAALKVQ
jgi:hypothetical protein